LIKVIVAISIVMTVGVLAFPIWNDVRLHGKDNIICRAWFEIMAAYHRLRKASVSEDRSISMSTVCGQSVSDVKAVANVGAGERIVEGEKFVVDVDVVGFTTIASALESACGVTAIEALNKAVLERIVTSVSKAGREWNEVCMASTGDGALLVFDRIQEVLAFSQDVSTEAAKHTLVDIDERWSIAFRIGVAHGLIAKSKWKEMQSVASIAIARAVRLQSQAAPGWLLMDAATSSHAAAYVPPALLEDSAIVGNRGELLPAKRMRLNPMVFLRPMREITSESAGVDEPESPNELRATLDQLSDSEFSALVHLLELSGSQSSQADALVNDLKGFSNSLLLQLSRSTRDARNATLLDWIQRTGVDATILERVVRLSRQATGD
jgi:hypothetical protein